MMPTPIVRTFLTDIPAATAQASLSLMSKRGEALAELLRSLTEVRQPGELLAVQAEYWSHLLEDYQDAFREGLSQLTAPVPAPGRSTPMEAPRPQSDAA
jgi:hypothetical protein